MSALGSSSSPKPIVSVIGSLNVDLVTYTPRIPAAGETMTASSFRIAQGGKGANQAVACAKLTRTLDDLTDSNVVVRMVGALGEDEYADMTLKTLRGYGVDVSGVQKREGKKTGVAVIIVEEATGQNRIMLSPEANHSLRPEDFREDFLAPRPALIILQLEIPLDTVLQIMDTARRQDIPVLLNPAPAQKIPIEYYRGLAHLVVNETEAALLADCSESDLDDEEGMKRVADIFRGYGVQNVLITLGGRGVYYSSESDGLEGLLPAYPAKVVDTTAAGDTFVGMYAVSWAEHINDKSFDIRKVAGKASLAASLTVQKKGAQESIPWQNDLLEDRSVGLSKE